MYSLEIRRSIPLRVICVSLVLMVGATGASADPAAEAACDRLLESYLQAVIAGDVNLAASHWRPADLAAATRLEIRYTGPPLKVDGDSPLWPHRGALMARRIVCRREPPAPVASGALAGVMRQIILLAGDVDTLRFAYYFAEQDGRWRLASPVALLMDGGGAHTGRFVTVHDRRSGSPAAAADVPTAALDSCVRDMTARLEVTEDVEARLVKGKLGYLLAESDDVERLAGAPTVGVANLQQDVVVTSHPCHAHELAHLVINAWLQVLPPYTLPLLQEGVAVHLGGRWGRHARILERLGRTTLAEELVTLDELLTREGFHRLPADLSYAPAGVFAGFVLDTYGPAALRAACLAASGDADSLSAQSADRIKAILAASLGTSWDDVVSAFNRHVAAPTGSGIEPGEAAVDGWSTAQLRGGRLHVIIRGEPSGLLTSVAIEANSGRPSGAVLMGGGDNDAPANALFSEHFPGRRYRGETHALIFTPDEAKIYDYRLQMLVALHAEGFWPSVSFVTADGRGLRFCVEGALWPAGSLTLVESDRQGGVR